MKIYFYYSVKEHIPYRKVIVAKIIKGFKIFENFIFVTALKKDSHFSLF